MDYGPCAIGGELVAVKLAGRKQPSQAIAESSVRNQAAGAASPPVPRLTLYGPKNPCEPNNYRARIVDLAA